MAAKIRNQHLLKKRQERGKSCDKQYRMYVKTGGATMLLASGLTYIQWQIMKSEILSLASKFDAKIEVSFLKPTH